MMMLLIDYEIKSIKKHGSRIYTKQDIKNGMPIAKVIPDSDVDISADEFNLLNEIEKKAILHWGFYDEPHNVYHISLDSSEFMYLVVKRNIKANEELLQNYLDLESQEEFNAKNNNN